MCYFDHKGLEPSGSVHCREQPSCVESCLDVFIPQLHGQFCRQTDWLWDHPLLPRSQYIRNHSPIAQHHNPEDFSLDSAARVICTFMLYIYWQADIIFIVTGFEIYVCSFHKFDFDSHIFWPA